MRVVVGEDQPITRQGIVGVLEEAGFEVVGVAADAPDLIRKARAHRPDVVIADIQMPPGNTDDGLRAAQQIRAEAPDVGVLVFSQHLDGGYALDLVGDHAGGAGYLLKDRLSDLSVFTDAVRRVAHGGSALDPEVVQRMVARPRLPGPAVGVDAARARGAGADRRGSLECRDRGAADGDGRRDRAACDEHLRQAGAAHDPGRPPARARRAPVPETVNR